MAGDADAGVGQRDAVLARLAGRVLDVARPHPVRVAVDGCSAVGKTTLADELAEVLRGRTTRAVIRVGIDQFKRAVHLRPRIANARRSAFQYKVIRSAVGGRERPRGEVLVSWSAVAFGYHA